jgi:hypothetical protein
MDPTVDVTDRERFLQELVELSGGDTSASVPLEGIADRLRLPREQAVLIAESLCTGLPGSAFHGLIRPSEGEDYTNLRITDAGLDFLEQPSLVSTVPDPSPLDGP